MDGLLWWAPCAPVLQFLYWHCDFLFLDIHIGDNKSLSNTSETALPVVVVVIFK